MVNGATYKLLRYGEDIFLDPQAAIPRPKTCNRTQSGKTCQRWNANSPHYPEYRPITATHNNCANPDGDDKPWCYTTDSNVRWEYCHQECEVLTTTTTTTTMTSTTTTTTTSTPKPLQIIRTVKPGLYHHMIKPYDHGRCGIQQSNKLKSKMSTYSSKGFCWICKQSVRRQKRVYYADDKATSFDFPWFVRVGKGSRILIQDTLFINHINYISYKYFKIFYNL